jgi:hypothetical protein
MSKDLPTGFQIKRGSGAKAPNSVFARHPKFYVKQHIRIKVAFGINTYNFKCHWCLVK